MPVLRSAFLIALWAANPLPIAAGSTAAVFHVAPDGNDAWTGRLVAPNANHTDGPLATLSGARNAIRRLRDSNRARTPVDVLLRGGVYAMTKPFVLEPRDSGAAEAPVVYAAYANERPTISGGQVVSGWKPCPNGLWKTHLPEVAAGRWYFHQLFVGGQRRTRARSPNQGYFYIAGNNASRPKRTFQFAPGEIKKWPDAANANIIVYHSWETSRHRIAEVDEAKRMVSFTGDAQWDFGYWRHAGGRQRYYVENVREALDAPGEWYLDRRSGDLFYYPLPGEDMASVEIVAPRTDRLLEIRGSAEPTQHVCHVIFRGLKFCHQDWALEPQGHSDEQAAVTVPAAIMADGARHCAFERCEVSHIGGYAIWLRRGCKNCRVVGSRLCDLGAGGLRIGETAMAPNNEAESSGNIIDNNHVFDGGHVFPAGVGVWVAQSSGNRISHNDIHDLCYSGVSVGWNWDDAPNRCHHNSIEFNHIHHVLKGVLSDGGAIYTLGVSTGSVIRNNLCHDVFPYPTPAFAWGIYLDASSNHYTVENNVVYNTFGGGIMFNNLNHENTICNNVFAFSVDAAIVPNWQKEPCSFTRNIVYATQGDVLRSSSRGSFDEQRRAKLPLGVWDENLYWHTQGPEKVRFFDYTLSQWQAFGLDRHSLIADPAFLDAATYDFRLKPDSPALRLGFRPIDVSKAGLYGDAAWTGEPRRTPHPKTELPPEK
jgi:hypothetical protein